MLSALRPAKATVKPRLPDGVRIYAMSDIHGCAHLLKQMLGVIDADVATAGPRHAIEVYLGDYIDRGPDSRATLDLLIGRSRRGNAVFLKGNHEAFLAEVFRDPTRMTDWFQFGGMQTLMSYGLSPSPIPDDEEQRALGPGIRRRNAATTSRIPAALARDFHLRRFLLRSCRRPAGIPLREQQETDLLWIREEFLRSQKHFGKYIVHGHTPVRSAEVLANRANIDTGAYATGNLTLPVDPGQRLLAV